MEAAMRAWRAPYRVVIETWKRLPDYRFIRDYFAMRTAYLKQAELRSKNSPALPPFLEWLPPTHRPTSASQVGTDTKLRTYSPAVVASVEQLVRLKLFPQAAFAKLDPASLRASGARIGGRRG